MKTLTPTRRYLPPFRKTSTAVSSCSVPHPTMASGCKSGRVRCGFGGGRDGSTCDATIEVDAIIEGKIEVDSCSIVKLDTE